MAPSSGEIASLFHLSPLPFPSPLSFGGVGRGRGGCDGGLVRGFSSDQGVQEGYLPFLCRKGTRLIFLGQEVDRALFLEGERRESEDSEGERGGFLPLSPSESSLSLPSPSIRGGSYRR